MSRSYGAVRPKKNLVTSVEDVLTLYDITRNTLTNWVKAGCDLSMINDRKCSEVQSSSAFMRNAHSPTGDISVRESSNARGASRASFRTSTP